MRKTVASGKCCSGWKFNDVGGDEEGCGREMKVIAGDVSRKSKKGRKKAA